VGFHNPAELAVGGCMKIVLSRANRKSGPENLMSAIVLTFVELSLAECTFQLGKKVGESLSVVPDMSATSVTTATVVTASLPTPESSVTLSEHCGRFEDGQVSRNCLDDLGRECSVVKRITEDGAFFSQ
jgi:hypothetical protein